MEERQSHGSSTGGVLVADLQVSPNPPEDSTEHVLSTLIKHSERQAGIEWPQAVSELSWSVDSLGIGFLVLSFLKKGKVHLPLRSFDVSKCEVSASKIFFLLSFLPASVDELTFGPATARGPALPLLCRFLEGRQDAASTAGASTETACLRLRSLTFAAGTIDLAEAPELFQLLPSELESLDLTDNLLSNASSDSTLDRKAVAALVEAVQAGKVSRLHTLILENTELEEEGVHALCSAMAAVKPLQIETLNLSGNRITCKNSLSQILRRDTLPKLQVLRLRLTGPLPSILVELAEAIEACELLSLQTLDLGGQWVGQRGGREVAESFRASTLPCLKELEVWVTGSAEPLLSALKSEDRPPLLETVNLSLFRPSHDQAKLLGGGELFFIQTLDVHLDEAASVTAFTSAAMNASQPPARQELFLRLGGTGASDDRAMKGLASALRVGRFGCLRELTLDSFGTMREKGKAALLEAFCNVQLPILDCLRLEKQGLTDTDVGKLAEAAGAGNFPSLRTLTLSSNPNFGRKGMERLMGAVCEGALDRVEQLNFSETAMGGGTEVIAAAVRAGKLTSLRVLKLRESGLTSEGLQALGAALLVNPLPCIRKLRLNGNELVGRDGMEGLMKGICEGGLPVLEDLDLSRTKMGEGGRALAAAVGTGRLKRLKVLNIFQSQWTADGMQALGKAIGDSPLQFLEELMLSGNTEIRLKEFLEALRPYCLPRLQRLHLMNFGVAAAQGKDLIAWAQKEGKLPGSLEIYL
uniref:Uncharacterized protein n=1 Tax=Chromera velia CCMP2878 TaxID=1169474 RepID=A0A0G4HJZ6_9ALVE|eukprot:Cvel_28332.t1-p1 / transcript=Cvel_28332.t1 / gene=Cvel_28332 / organism=Chromera_velia_CCMP2878 / gene_product=Ribonuclease inhibitor, putative / transcript_product=Ribonuclease inhibitor, putative / location=Cvel_scaffold3686:1441-7595(-) / protein_length=754 / sequence_SO=supercontig / SO=protein_coding / is_pseudo=false